MNAFLLTWAGQLVSLFGSAITSFALGLRVYGDSGGSITQFSLLYFFYFLPPLLLAPFAGALVDRWDRRTAMLLGDVGTAVTALATYGLLAAADAGHLTLRPWHFYLPMAANAVCDAFRWPAYAAATAQLVPPAHLGRANGLLELTNGLCQSFAPALAGVLVAVMGLRGIALLDVATSLVAIGTLLLVRFPPVAESAEGRAARGSLRREVAHGWRFVRERAGLLGLLRFAAVSNLLMAMILLLFTPLVLTFADERRLGLVLAVAGVGALAGAAVCGAWGGPRRRALGVALFGGLSGGVLLCGLFPPSVGLAAGVAFAYLFLSPFVASSLQTIWHHKVPPDLHGRVFAVRRMVGLAAPPVAALVAGPLAGGLFEPWMAPGGALADTVGRVIGVGPGRGLGLLFGVLGVVGVVNALATWLSPRVRHVESELPDALSARERTAA